MNPESITLTYQPLLSDVLHSARLAEGALWRTSSRVVAALLAVAAVLMWYWGAPGWALGFFLLSIAEWFNLLPLAVAVAWLEFHRNPKYKQQYSITLRPQGLLFVTEAVRSEIGWNFYRRFWESDRAFVLSYGQGLPTVIPKSAIKGDADLGTVRALLAEHVGGALS
ncbi:MAG: YcxB family protein [Vicinamibacteria bacterium]|nr:YcxB family protein [Vicinamibacteria bacterium]